VLVPDDGTARVVESLLRRAGYAVQRVVDPGALVRASQGFDVSLVIAAERSLPAALPRTADRSYQLFVLQDGNGSAAQAVQPTEILGLPLDPEEFAAALALPDAV
jgi:hypothetical protein